MICCSDSPATSLRIVFSAYTLTCCLQGGLFQTMYGKHNHMLRIAPYAALRHKASLAVVPEGLLTARSTSAVSHVIRMQDPVSADVAAVFAMSRTQGYLGRYCHGSQGAAETIPLLPVCCILWSMDAVTFGQERPTKRIFFRSYVGPLESVGLF